MKYAHLTSKPARHLLTQLRQLGSAARPRTQGEALEALEAIEVRAAERYETVAEEMERRSRQGA